MKEVYQILLIGVMSCFLIVSLASCGRTSVRHRENGWYLIANGQKDNLASTPIVIVKDFEALELDSDATEHVIGQRIGFVFNDTSLLTRW